MNMKKINSVVHFELGYNDKNRAIDFYSKTFGWDCQTLGPEMGGYVLAHTAETDKDGMIKKPGAINGGFYQKTENELSHAPSFVISVEDIQQAMNDVVAAGGKILGAMDNEGKRSDQPMMIPGVGLWIS